MSSFPITRITQIAQIAHAAERVYIATIGGEPQSIWNKLTETEQNAIIQRTTFQLDHPLYADSGIHNQWVAEQEAAGWTYGKEYDAEAKTDPKIKSFHLLPVELQTKDRLFAAIVKALSRV